MSASTVSEAKLNAFMDKLVGDLSGTYVTLLCSLGDRLGLFKNLAESGSCTSAEFAGRMGMDERYLREWLGALTAAGYLEYDPLSLRFALPPEHALPLVKEGDLMFVAGLHQALLADVKNLDRLAEAFKHGGGIPAEAYDQNEWDGLERFTSTWFESLLIQPWIPAVPDVKRGLERGISVADVSCGRGRGLIKLA